MSGNELSELFPSDKPQTDDYSSVEIAKNYYFELEKNGTSWDKMRCLVLGYFHSNKM